MVDFTGKDISHYRIIEQVGQGGMGVVYKARDIKLKRTVALKFLPSNLTRNETDKARFLQEAQAAAALNHPNVCTIHEIHDEGENPFIVMEYVAGKTLGEMINTPLSRIKSGTSSRHLPRVSPQGEKSPPLKGDLGGCKGLSINYIIDTAIQIAEALKAAHKKDIVHRDIKSENIMVTADGQVKVMDFGLAKLKGAAKLTKTTSTLGTVGYMSPEQTQGKTADHRSDIWSLGVVLYEMLTGELPFKGDYEQAVIYLILNENPEPVTEIRSDIPKELQKIIHKTLAKKPSERYKNVDELMEDFKKINTDSIPEKHEAFKGKAKQAQKPMVFGIILIAVIIIVGYFILKEKKEEPESQIISKTEKTTEIKWKNSIAVLPFVDMSPNKDQEYFCDGMAEEIINDLTNIENLRVIARTSAFSFKGKNEDVRYIGEKLNVATLLEGSVRKAGSQLRVTANLIRCSDSAYLWSKRFDCNLTDVFAVQDEIAMALVSRLKIKLFGGEEHRIVRRHTENLEAYNQYLMGRHLLNRRKREDIYTAISYFEKTLKIDSLYVMGYIGLADAYALLPSYSSAPQKISYFKAKEAVSKALQINDQIGEAYASLGWIKMLADWDWKGAERAFQKAVLLNPGYATAYHWYGYLNMYMGQFEKSISKVKKALELDPLSPVINRVIGDVFYYDRKYDEAIPALKRTLELEPGIPYGHSQLGLCYQQRAMYDEALKEFSEEKKYREDPSKVDHYIGITYVKMGEVDKARQILEKLQAGNAKDIGISQLCFVLGENEMGFKILEDMYRDHDTWLSFINITPGFDDVRSLPRFKEIIKKVGLE